MKARVVKPFEGVRDGDLYPRHFEVADVVQGDLARVAIAEGWAETLEPLPADGSASPRRRSVSR
jgi:hypothetical protein